ncbi:MAG: tetratricopeptide repeat protein [Anaerolineaceae bacterium]|nr:tetratricopeptide repeat protein [Anaerolineaceae bacterium]
MSDSNHSLPDSIRLHPITENNIASNDLEGPTTFHSPFWNIGSLIGLALLVYHLLALWYRWLRPDSEFLAFSASVAELLAIGSFIGFQTERGQDIANKFEDTFLINKLFGTPKMSFSTIWIVVLITGVFLYLGSPVAARLYRQSGSNALENGEYSKAIHSFEQAISLFPDEARAHFNLASTYEALHDEDKAIDEYQLALELENDFWPTYNNLGRLFLEVRGRPDAALEILLAGEKQADSDLGMAVLGKNIAQAYFEVGLPNNALKKIEEAESLFYEIWLQGDSIEIYLAETSQIKAQIFISLLDEVEAIQAWQDSLGYSLAISESTICKQIGIQPPPDCLRAQLWAAKASEQISALREAIDE